MYSSLADALHMLTTITCSCTTIAHATFWIPV